jgi:glutaminase
MRIIQRTLIAAAAVALVTGAVGSRIQAQAPSNVQAAVDAAFAKFRTLKEGKNADYIPALAKVDPNLFGIAVVTADGKVYTAGDIKTEVSIQSISKVFTMAQVIQEQGLDSIAKQIGVDATGARFNSIIAIEGVRTVVGTGAPEMNALVNPGAISATSMVKGLLQMKYGRRSSASTTTSRAATSPCCRTFTSRNPTPTSATRRSAR